ncbi:MAG: SDR family NAD(P)-dependent oxidoreductase, partial [Spongiibacteraceae bacterium]
MARLTGKKFLITGASGFMGGDFARAFAREGADLVLTSRTLSKLETLAAELRRDHGCSVHCCAADMCKPEDVKRLAEFTWSAFDGIDGVLLSAQPENTFLGDILTTPDEQWAAQHDMLVWGPLRLLRDLAPKMMARGKGSIVTVISSTGLHPTP